MSKMPKTNERLISRKFGIFGHVGNENLGDEAIIAAVIQNIRHHYPNAQICGFTANPDDTAKRHQIECFYIRRMAKSSIREGKASRENSSAILMRRQSNLREEIKNQLKKVSFAYGVARAVYKTPYFIVNLLEELRFFGQVVNNLRKLDYLIIAGSGQLADWFGGAWGFPYNIFRWSLAAKLVGVKVLFMNVGAGPIRSPLSKFFIRYSLSQATYRSYRDKGSRELIKSLGIHDDGSVFPDLAYSLRADNKSLEKNSFRASRVIGINPIPFCADFYWPYNDKARYQNYIRILSEFVLWLIDREYKVLLFPTQLKADPRVIVDIKAIIEKDGASGSKNILLSKPILTVNDLLSEISRMDLVVAARFHGILLSFVMRKPVLGISYHAKTNDLMTEMGQSEYLLDINNLTTDSLKERFNSLESKQKLLKCLIEERVSGLCHTLDIQYDNLFRLVEKHWR